MFRSRENGNKLGFFLKHKSRKCEQIKSKGGCILSMDEESLPFERERCQTTSLFNFMRINFTETNK